jgi:hypothetical protein
MPSIALSTAWSRFINTSEITPPACNSGTAVSATMSRISLAVTFSGGRRIDLVDDFNQRSFLFEGDYNGAVPFLDIRAVARLRQSFPAAVFNHCCVMRNSQPILLAPDMPRENRECVQQSNRYGRARTAVSSNLIECSVHDIWETHSVRNNAQLLGRDGTRDLLNEINEYAETHQRKYASNKTARRFMSTSYSSATRSV